MTLFTAFIAFLGDQTPKPHPAIFAGMAVVLLMFWVMDAMFKSIQKVYILRGLEIEQEIRKPGFYEHLDRSATGEPHFPGIEHSFMIWHAQKYSKIWAELFEITVITVYIVLIVLDLVLALFLK